MEQSGGGRSTGPVSHSCSSLEGKKPVVLRSLLDPAHVPVCNVPRIASVDDATASGFNPAAIRAAVMAPAEAPATPLNQQPLLAMAFRAPPYATPFAPPPSNTP